MYSSFDCPVPQDDMMSCPQLLFTPLHTEWSWLEITHIIFVSVYVSGVPEDRVGGSTMPARLSRRRDNNTPPLKQCPLQNVTLRSTEALPSKAEGRWRDDTFIEGAGQKNINIKKTKSTKWTGKQPTACSITDWGHTLTVRNTRLIDDWLTPPTFFLE